MSSQPAHLGLSDPSLLKHHGFINGEWVAARSGATFDVHNPATGELLGAVPEMGSEEETEHAIQCAKTAFESWRNTSPKERQNVLVKLFNLMMEHGEDLAKIIVRRVVGHGRAKLVC